MYSSVIVFQIHFDIIQIVNVKEMHREKNQVISILKVSKPTDNVQEVTKMKIDSS